ncbi:hypothetical protein C8J57DRAFT_1301605, partial [Mycena rebaudengoi]
PPSIPSTPPCTSPRRAAALGARHATAEASRPRRRSLIIWVWPISRAPPPSPRPRPPRSTTVRSCSPRWRARSTWAWGSACRLWAGAAYPALVLMPMVVMGVRGVVELKAVMCGPAGGAEQHEQQRPRPTGCAAFPAYARCHPSSSTSFLHRIRLTQML